MKENFIWKKSTSGSGVSSFITLTDTPSNFTGQSGKAVFVNSAEDALEFSEVSTEDEKVKYDSEDPTAGYVADKIIAGDGISVAEGTGTSENKLVITNDDKGSDVDLSGYAKLDGSNQPFTGDITANSFITDGGTSSDFVKGDGSFDSSTYLS